MTVHTDREIKSQAESVWAGPPMTVVSMTFISDLLNALTRTRWVAADDMVGVMELADFFSVGRTNISMWAARRHSNGMPLPIAQLAATPVYSRSEVVAWWKEWTPVKGAKAGKLPPEADPS